MAWVIEMSEEIKRIKEAIKNSKLSYMELERLTGVSHSTLQRYMNGKTNRIPLSAIAKIAAATGVTPSYLMGWDEQPILLDSDTEIDPFIGQKILFLRNGKQINIEDFTNELNNLYSLNIDINTVRSWEACFKIPPLKAVVCIAKYFNTPLTYFLEKNNEKNNLIDKLVKIARSLSSEQIEVLITVAESISGNSASKE